MEKFIIYNAIKTPDGTILESVYRHDYKKYVDTISNETYIIDGGTDYVRTSVNNAPSESLVVYSTDDFNVVRNHLKRGTFDEDGNRLYKIMSECSDNHVKNIITYLEDTVETDLRNSYIKLWQKELEYRKENNIIVEE